MPLHLKNAWPDKVRRWWFDYEWPVIGILALGVFTLGFIGFTLQLPNQNKPVEFFDLIFRSCRLFLLAIDTEPPVPWQLDIARLLAPLVAAYTAVQALARLFADQMRSLRLRYRRGHVVVCGLGHKGYHLAIGFLRAGQHVVIVERNAENDFLPQCRADGALIIHGDAAESDVLLRAGVARARCVLAVCGDDGVNAKVAALLRVLPRDPGVRSQACLIHIGDPDLFTTVRPHGLATEALGGLRLEFFNLQLNGARALFARFPLFQPALAVDQLPRLLVVGAGQTAEAVVVEAARSWRQRFAGRNEQLAITLVAPEAADRIRSWKIKHPLLTSCVDLHPVPVALDSAEFQRADFAAPATLVTVCLDEDDARNVSTALILHRRRPAGGAPVVACLITEDGLPTLLDPVERDAGGSGGLHFFGLIDQTCRPELLPGGVHERLAVRLHEIYLGEAERQGARLHSSPNLARWEDLPEEFRESSRLAADFIWAKLPLLLLEADFQIRRLP